MIWGKKKIMAFLLRIFAFSCFIVKAAVSTMLNRHAWLLSQKWLFAIPWTVAPGHLCPWNFPSKNTGVGCHFLLQGIFPNQGSNLIIYVSCIASRFVTTEPSGKPMLDRQEHLEPAVRAVSGRSFFQLLSEENLRIL